MRITLTAIAMCLMCTTAVATPRTMSILTDAVADFGALNFQYTHKLGDRGAGRIAVFLPVSGAMFVGGFLGAGVGYRFYLTGLAYENGWYIEPGVYYGMTGLYAPPFGDFGQIKYAVIAPEVEAGYSWCNQSGFTLDLGLKAIGAIDLQIKGNARLPWPVVPIPMPTLRLGYAW
jgi:hypothetical protein